MYVYTTSNVESRVYSLPSVDVYVGVSLATTGRVWNGREGLRHKVLILYI
jgi:hypothetical protein